MGDLINRQDAIDALDNNCDVICQYSIKERSVMCGACPLGTAFDVIDELPSAQERKTGKWLKYDGVFDYDVKCSECECSHYYETDYCPNCGADMRGGDAE